MGVVAKMFISQRVDGPMGQSHFILGVVCRGELNKDWAAATPSGSGKLISPILAKVWEDAQAGKRQAREVYVQQTPSPDGDFEMRSCGFAYNGCTVKFTKNGDASNGYQAQELEFTVNASPATKVLRKAYADGLLAGVAPRFTISVADEADA